MRTDLISRSKLHTSLNREEIKVVDGLQYLRADVVLAKISMAPSVDAVEVVRCRKCKHFVKYDDDYRDEYGSDGYCDKIAYIMDGYYRGAENRNADDFCSHGERMDATDNNVGHKDGGAKHA